MTEGRGGGGSVAVSRRLLRKEIDGGGGLFNSEDRGCRRTEDGQRNVTSPSLLCEVICSCAAAELPPSSGIFKSRSKVFLKAVRGVGQEL